MKLDIMGIAETRWTDIGRIVKDDYTMIYSGGKITRMELESS